MTSTREADTAYDGQRRAIFCYNAKAAYIFAVG